MARWTLIRARVKTVSGIALGRGGGGGGGQRTRWRVFNDNSSYLLAAHAVQSCVPPLLGIRWQIDPI